MDSLEKTSNGGVFIDSKEQARIKRMENALNRIITSVNHGWYKGIRDIAKEALKDE